MTSRAGYSVERNLRYGEGERARFDLYRPTGMVAETPVVVFIHGGAWDSGSKDLYRFVGQSLASEGIAVAVPNYRLYPQVQFPAFVEDAAQAVATIETASRAGRDGFVAGRHPIFLMGHSAGGQIGALLALDKHYLRDAGTGADRLSGFIGLAGAYDFLPLTEERYKRVFPPQRLDESQPIRFVKGREIPMLLLAGEADRTVNPDNTRSLARRLERTGSPVRSAILPGTDHIGIVSGLATALPVGDRSVRASVLAFIKEHS